MKYIYALMSGQLVLYIGQTSNYSKRFTQHYRRKSSCGSKEIPADMKIDYLIIECCYEDCHANIREAYYINLLNPLYNEKIYNKKDYRVTLTKKNSPYIIKNINKFVTLIIREGRQNLFWEIL